MIPNDLSTKFHMPCWPSRWDCWPGRKLWRGFVAWCCRWCWILSLHLLQQSTTLCDLHPHTQTHPPLGHSSRLPRWNVDTKSAVSSWGCRKRCSTGPILQHCRRLLDTVSPSGHSTFKAIFDMSMSNGANHTTNVYLLWAHIWASLERVPLYCPFITSSLVMYHANFHYTLWKG